MIYCLLLNLEYVFYTDVDLKFIYRLILIRVCLFVLLSDAINKA